MTARGTLMESPDEALLAQLRAVLEQPDLAFVESPAQISGGFDTKIYGFRLADAPAAWSAPLVLRVFRPETSPAKARFEAAVQNCLAGLGMCVPRVLLVVEDPAPLGGAFSVMERAAGRNLLHAVFSLAAPRVPGWLADTQARLHGLDARALESALAAAGFDPALRSFAGELAEYEQAVESHGLDGLRAGLDWLERERPPAPALPAICHGDFHPLNVVADRGRVTGLIDWARVHLAWPEYDVGTTRALLSHGPIRVPAWLAPPARAVRAGLRGAYLAAYRRRRPLDPERLRYFEAARLLGFLLEEGAEQVAEPGASSKGRPWASAEIRRGIRTRFESLTGVAVALPDDA